MKKIILLVIIVFALNSLFAEEPHSMRYIATDGVFDGEWEHVFDTIELQRIDKLYFFTNFADINIEYDEEIGEVSEKQETRFFEKLPLGVAFKNPFMKKLRHAFYLGLRQNKIPEEGEYEEYVTTYEDITGDDIYDIKTITHKVEEDYAEDDSSIDFVWNNNLMLSKFVLGFKFASFSMKEELDNLQNNHLGEYDFGDYGLIYGFDYGDDQLDYYTEIYDIEEEDYYFRYGEKGDFQTIMKDSYNEIQFSLENPNCLLSKNSKIRVDLGMIMDSNVSYDTEDSYFGEYHEIVENAPIEYTGMISEDYVMNIEINKNSYYLSALFTKYLNSSFMGEKGFWEAHLRFDLDSGERIYEYKREDTSEEIEEHLNFSENTVAENFHNTTSTEENGDISGTSFTGHWLANLPLNDFANFGLGGYYYYSHLTGNYDYIVDTDGVTSYQIGSAIDTENEFTQTTTQYLSADKQTITEASTIRIPVAFEFKIPDNHTSINDGFGLRNFIFRLGSTFALRSTKVENTYDVIEKQPNFVITEYGDGTVTENHDAENELNSNKGIMKTIQSSKRFSGGIGYVHSENVNIDLGGYFDYDTEEYLIGISFTIKR